ncbi:MAG: hypothetical protein WCD20_04920 [Rhodomicrobium sp.]
MADFGGFTAEVFSGVAVIVSGYSLWQTSLRRARLRVFVPPLIRYASPYQNSIFEIFEVPLLQSSTKAPALAQFCRLASK